VHQFPTAQRGQPTRQVLELGHGRVELDTHQATTVQRVDEVAAPGQRDGLVLLALVVAHDHDAHRPLGRALRGIGHLDRRRVALRSRFQRPHLEVADARPRRRAVDAAVAVVVGADAHDVARATAVQEVPVHGVAEVGAGRDVTEQRHVLAPIGDHRRHVDRALRGHPDEPGDGRAHALDGCGAGRHLFDVDPG
jgi:hypothetical protein